MKTIRKFKQLNTLYSYGDFIDVERMDGCKEVYRKGNVWSLYDTHDFFKDKEELSLYDEEGYKYLLVHRRDWILLHDIEEITNSDYVIGTSFEEI